MSPRVVTWSPLVEPLGACVVAIGVFDGVHLGHQALLESAVADARRRAVPAAAVTFDRDPDQIVSPTSAAPQLLTLADKDRYIGETGIDTILVVPFTAELAALQPRDFVESVLLCALTPLATYVGHDFRFGRGASGDVAELARVLAAHDAQVIPHELVTVDDESVTSTRIRSLVAEGRVAEAARLLGRPTRVAGTVHRGRGEGATIGFPTANVVPVDFAALPGDGVYAGVATFADGQRYPAAISVGTPPMFPQARDYLEAHLPGFEGELYGETLTLEFYERLRDQQEYASLEGLVDAIGQDVERTLAVVGEAEHGLAQPDRLGDGSLVVDDPEALEAAERAVQTGGPVYFQDIAIGEWRPVVDGISLGEAFGSGARASMFTGPLENAGIPYVWDPYPPESRPTSLPGAGTYPQPFTLLVPENQLDEARTLLADTAELAPRSEAGTATPPAEATRCAALGEGPAEGWVYALRDMRFDAQRLGAIQSAFIAANIGAAWEPYDPREAPLLRLGIWGTERFSVAVPVEDLDAARELLGELGETGEPEDAATE